MSRTYFDHGLNKRTWVSSYRNWTGLVELNMEQFVTGPSPNNGNYQYYTATLRRREGQGVYILATRTGYVYVNDPSYRSVSNIAWRGEIYWDIQFRSGGMNTKFLKVPVTNL